MKTPPVKDELRASAQEPRARGRPRAEADPDFVARLREAIGSRSVNSVARATGISEGLLRGYLRGVKPGGDKLVALSSTLAVRLEWLATGSGSRGAGAAAETAFLERDTVQVPLYPVELSAGHGRSAWPGGEPIGRYPLPLATVRAAHAPIASLAGFHVHGSSMEPGIRHGDIAILDLSRTVIRPRGGLYAVRLDDALHLKRLAWEGDDLVLRSDNQAEYPPVRVQAPDAERLEVVGFVVFTFHAAPGTAQT